RTKENLLAQYGYYSDLDRTVTGEEWSARAFAMRSVQPMLTRVQMIARAKLRNGVSSQLDTSQIDEAVSEVDARYQLAKQKAANSPPAKEAASQGKDTSLMELARTSLIRFGGVAVILFLVSLLIPIYRYNVRLGTFYLARADAL